MEGKRHLIKLTPEHGKNQNQNQKLNSQQTEGKGAFLIKNISKKPVANIICNDKILKALP